MPDVTPPVGSRRRLIRASIEVLGCRERCAAGVRKRPAACYVVQLQSPRSPNRNHVSGWVDFRAAEPFQYGGLAGVVISDRDANAYLTNAYRPGYPMRMADALESLSRSSTLLAA